MKTKKQTKLFKWLLLLILLLMLPQIASAYDFKVNKLCYNFNEDGTSVTVTYERLPTSFMQSSYLNLSDNLNIPEIVTHNGTDYLVTAIGNHAFEFCTDLTSVIIPNSVTLIDYVAFHGCSNV